MVPTTLSPISRRKRKADDKLVLDWEVLLGDNEPPPQLLVVEAAKSKPQVIMMLGEDKESQKDLWIQGLSDKELADKISRAENMLGNYPSSFFPDGGAKLRLLLQRQVAERERRKLLKAKATLLAHDKPIRIDAIDELASPPVPASQSSFASRFCNKLDDKFKQGPPKSFTNEMSTLNRCNYTRGSSLLAALMRTKKIGLSSRHTPFKPPPSNLTDHTNDSSQPNIEHFGRHFEKKENARRVQPMRSCKLNNIQHSQKSALAAQTARAKRAGGELAQAEWLKEKEELIAAHKAELEAVKEKSWAEGYKQGQDELKGLQTLF